jgi:hypothetical protein
MRVLSYACLAAVLAVSPFAAGGSALAQGNQQGAIYYGQVKATPSCPAISWRFRHSSDRTVVGYIIFENAQGVSKATGERDADGRFRLTVVPIDGNGPAGTVTGMRAANGAVTATANFEGCPPLSLTPPGRPATALPSDAFGGGMHG